MGSEVAVRCLGGHGYGRMQRSRLQRRSVQGVALEQSEAEAGEEH